MSSVINSSKAASVISEQIVKMKASQAYTDKITELKKEVTHHQPISSGAENHKNDIVPVDNKPLNKPKIDLSA